MLKEAGFDATHWIDLGSVSAPDSEIFDWARKHGAEAPSVFQIRTHDVTPNVLGLRAIGLLRRFEKELNEGALIVADEWLERVRLLPLSK
jgi:predicted nuclease of predicted toxin-antitoxin system